jgi:predicted DNA-binding transcriptional regulator YafY
VIVRFDKKVVRYLQEQKYLNGFVSEEDLGDYTCMKFLTSSVEYFGRWLLMYGNTATIESPEALQAIMKELAERLLAHHGAY